MNDTMIQRIENRSIAFVGGGRFCEQLLRHLLGDGFGRRKPKVLAVADFNADAAGMRLARSLDLPTCTDYRDLYTLDGLETIVEVTWDLELAGTIARTKPSQVELINHQEARYLWDLLQLETIRDEALIALGPEGLSAEAARERISNCFGRAADILNRRNRRFAQVETQLHEQEKSLAQIVAGSTIPTFVIDRDHVVTHWNRALEKLTGYPAEKMVGSRDHWKPFRKKERPIMADVILDQLETGEIDHYYGSRWQPSTLIEDGFEAEEFFEHLGEGGRWLFFTAAPIRGSDGQLDGAIETLWDTTEQHRTESERRSYTRRIEASEQALAQIVQGSTIPTFVLDQDRVITHWNLALERLTGYAGQRMVGTRRQWEPFWNQERPTMADVVLERRSEAEIRELYGGQWQPSKLIEGAYEAEFFFPKLGEGGCWLFFTAAPIRAADGRVTGAIETFWDITAKKDAEAQCDRYILEVEESQRTLAQIVQGSTIPTFVLNREHRITHWNQALEKLSGRPAEKMVGTDRQWDPFYESARATMADVILDQKSDAQIRNLYGGQWKKSDLIEGAYEAEIFFPNLGDDGLWCWFTAAPIRSGDGQLVGAIETLVDTTAAKRAEEEQRRRNRELTTLCSIYTALNAPATLKERIDGVVEEVRQFFSVESVCLYMAEDDGSFDMQSFNACYADPGRPHEQPDGEKEKIRTVVQTDKPLVRWYANGTDSGHAFAYIPISAKDTKGMGVMRIEKAGQPFSDDELHLLDLIGNRIGATIENTLLHDEVIRKSNFQAKLIKSANDGIIAMDEDWKTLIFNPAAEQIFGYATGEVVGSKDARDYLPEWTQKALTEAPVGETESSAWQESAIQARDGKPIPVRFSGSRLQEKGRRMGSVAFFQDLREIKRLEQELVNSERLAAVGQTVAGMAHCIKNILHGFKGGSYLMNVGLERDNTDKLRDGWGMIQRNITRTSDLVMDLLSYSKQREPEYENCHPNEIAADVVELMVPLAEEHGIELVQRLSDEIVPVVMDPRSVHRCLMNLVTNALDACIFDTGAEKNYRVIIATAKDNDTTIRFDVIDNGSGMSEEVRAKLFSSFFSTKGVKGTGLGLLVTAKLVEEHGGSIEVKSVEGEGTTFSLRFAVRLIDNNVDRSK